MSGVGELLAEGLGEAELAVGDGLGEVGVPVGANADTDKVTVRLAHEAEGFCITLTRKSFVVT